MPSSRTGAANSTPLSSRNATFLPTAALRYMDSCMASPATIGIPAPRPTVRTVETGASSMPFASLPIVLAVAGYATIASDLP